MDLVEFLRARLDEDEQAARDAEQAHPPVGWLIAYDPETLQARSHGPARVLAEVEAKRLLLDGLHPSLLDGESTLAIAWGNDPDHSGTLLKILGLPYASHPDYRDEWRP